MNNLKLNKNFYKLLAAAGITSFILLTTGCSSKENNIETTYEITTTTENNNKHTNTNETEQTENKEETFDNFESEKKEINNLIYTENFELADKVWSEYFIDAIDMIFYDKEYKDTKWSELNPEAQQKVIENLNNIDASITKIYPEYKDDWEKTKGVAASLYFKALNKIKDLIGEENYNAIKNKKDNIKDNIKDKANELYQNYKSKHK